MTHRFRLKSRDRRALLIGLAIVTPVAAYRVAVSPWLRHMSELRTTLATERDLLAREQGTITEAQQLPDQMAALAGDLKSVQPRLLPGASTMEASGALSRYVTSLGVENGILIQQAETRATQSVAGSLQSTSLEVRALGDLEGVARFLHGLENGPRLMHVDALSIRPAGVNDGDLDRGELLSTSVLVTGYWLGTVDEAQHGTAATVAGGA